MFLFSDEQARVTYQNLRDTFRKQLQHESRSDQEATDSDKWSYLKSILFLKDIITPGPSSEKKIELSPRDRSSTTALEKSTNVFEMCLSSEEQEKSASMSSSVKVDRNRLKSY